MNDERALTPDELLEREMARLLEEAEAIKRYRAERARIQAKYGANPSPRKPLPVPIQDASGSESVPDTPHNTGPRIFDGSVGSLIACYKTQPSPYQKLRHKTRLSYGSLLRRLERDLGAEKVESIDAERILRAHEQWVAVSGPSMAHSLITMLRGLASFGSETLKERVCRELRVVLHDIRVPNIKPRNGQLTAEHANSIRVMARDEGVRSVALAQAFQFDCSLRQKDVIGEWVPRSEPGIEYFVSGDMKWLRGLRWEEIDDNLILRHILSFGQEKKVEIDLTAKRMVMEELRLGHPGFVGSNRAALPTKGPIIMSESLRKPWTGHEYRRRWRKIATRAGVPSNVYNMDSRATTQRTGIRQIGSVAR